jgi:hypothetical protein
LERERLQQILDTLYICRDWCDTDLAALFYVSDVGELLMYIHSLKEKIVYSEGALCLINGIVSHYQSDPMSGKVECVVTAALVKK